jgi:hypothetical protein
MENEEKVMTGEESLKIITEMINRTKTTICQGSFYLLFWGWLVFFCSFSEYLIRKLTDYSSPWNVWLLTIPGIFVSLAYGFVKGRKSQVHTYTASIYMWTWLGFLVSALILYAVAWGRWEIFSPLILTLVAVPTFVSGIILKFRPLIIGAVTFWVFALVSRFGGPEIAPLAVPVSMLTGYLIPGYLLKRKENHDTV